MNRVKRNSTKKQKIIVISIIALLLLIGVYVFVAYFNHIFPFANTSPSYEPGTHIINMDKTNTEKQAIDSLNNNPQDKTQNQQTDTPPTPTVNATSGKKEANVLITNAGISNGTVSVSGFVSNVVESDGSCTYTFTNGSSQIAKPSNVLPNPTSTTCATVSFPASELPVSGTWSVELSYSSAQSAGSSSAKEFQK